MKYDTASARNLRSIIKKLTFLAVIPFISPASGKTTTLITKYIKIFLLAFSICFLANPKILAIPTIDIVGPAGSGSFGGNFGGVAVLPNGNLVIVDSLFDQGGVTDIGAVYLYNGTTLSLISTLKGSSMSDVIGSGGIHVLPNGNFVVVSTDWDNGAATNAGAVTLCNATTGCNGTVSPANSLVGGTTNDRIGYSNFTFTVNIFTLSNGNYVVRSPDWDNGANADAGAITWCSGTSATVGLVSAANSLVGGTASDQIGGTSFFNNIIALTNGNYVVGSPRWNNGTTVDAGAVTWGNGNGGTVGLISSANSLVGGSSSDAVGDIVRALTNGNYVASSATWDRVSPTITNAGAVTWGNGSGGTVGLVSPANSLVGGMADDRVGDVSPLPNGNYIVRSSNWSNPTGPIFNVGAVTLCNSTGGSVGLISSANSLIGGSSGDTIGTNGAVLSNGKFVVSSPFWDNPSPARNNAGAITLVNAAGGTVGLVTPANSLVGGADDNLVGLGGVWALNNGNYVVLSPEWDNPSPFVPNVGAATWGNGVSGTVGTVSSANSLLGGRIDDFNGARIYALTNGNYVLASPFWDKPSPTVFDVGAVIRGNGSGGTVGFVSSANSLVGNSQSDQVGEDLTVLTNGNYVVCSPKWDNGATTDAGAATWNNGTGGTVGLVSSANSLVGGSNNDEICNRGVTPLTNGNYVVASPFWDNPSPLTVNTGAATWGNGTTGIIGLVTPANSFVGGTGNDNLTDVGGVPPLGVIFRNIRALQNGNFTFISRFWTNPVGPVTQAGAITIGNGSGNNTGLLSSANSIFGPSTGSTGDYLYDNTNNRLIVPRGGLNRVTVQVFNLPRTPFDFDGDNKTDISIFRPAPAEWWLYRSATASVYAAQFGNSSDRIAPADFTGDGKTDIAFFRPSTGEWYILRSEDSSFLAFPFGTSGDTPVPADYDGDNKADAAVFRPSTNTWFIQKSAGGTDIIGFGTAGDKPVVGDYDGDGKADIAIWRPSVGQWWIRRSSDTSVFAATFGTSTDKPVQGFYTADNKADMTFWRPSTGEWYILRSEDFSFYSFPFGASSDIPVPGDYDGDGRFDAAVFRPSETNWYIQRTTAGTLIQQFGVASDKPVPNAFVP